MYFVPFHSSSMFCAFPVVLLQKLGSLVLRSDHSSASCGCLVAKSLNPFSKITPAFNLPCEYVLHTVGPIISGKLRAKDKELLASCYRSCLELADSHGIKSIAFCCISTGEFHFPNDVAAEIAVATVKDYVQQKHSEIEVIFNVFKNVDYEIYRKILGSN